MKIGIVTVFHAHNYGGVLQAYSLWQFLSKRGHNVEFIAQPYGYEKKISLIECFLSRSISSLRYKLQCYASYKVTGFSSQFPQTKYFKTYNDLIHYKWDYDVVLVGSDQMWNPNWCTVRDYLWCVFLDFLPRSIKRVGYAVSFGTKSWTHDKTLNHVGDLLNKFTAISTREDSGVLLVKRLSNRNDAQCIVDPTLLHNSDFYRSLMARNNDSYFNLKLKKGRYIFKYFLQWTDVAFSKNIVNIVKDLFSIEDEYSEFDSFKGVKSLAYRLLGVRRKVYIEEWLSRIANSECVVTNSFHGTIFSLIFHRPFVVISLKGRHSGMNERIYSILNKVGLASHIVDGNDSKAIELAVKDVINWNKVDDIINAEQSKSIDFLKSVGL